MKSDFDGFLSNGFLVKLLHLKTKQNKKSYKINIKEKKNTNRKQKTTRIIDSSISGKRYSFETSLSETGSKSRPHITWELLKIIWANDWFLLQQLSDFFDCFLLKSWKRKRKKKEKEKGKRKTKKRWTIYLGWWNFFHDKKKTVSILEIEGKKWSWPLFRSDQGMPHNFAFSLLMVFLIVFQMNFKCLSSLYLQI